MNMEIPRNANQANLQDTSEKYGRLYAFFLEVCRCFIDDEVHVRMRLPEDGREMYDYLDEVLCSRYDEPYDEIIYGFHFLSMKEKQILAPRDGVINVENLDIGIYLKIISILGGCLKYETLGHYLTKVRNNLCHIPVVSLRRRRSQYDFDIDIVLIGQRFQLAGISRTLLDDCEMRIFNRVIRR